MTVQEFQERFGIVGRSKAIRDLADIAMQVARSNVTALLSGESGVGKEVFARAIHGYSDRADKRLVSVNCGAIPEGILESELFGHVKGSFTGAAEARKGYFEQADGGTLFLDEIAETPIATQAKLLRAIENKEFMRLGAETITKVDVRFVAATNKDLETEVAAKRFRKDLYFRLKAVTLNIPPLRERKIDVEELALKFARDFGARRGNGEIELTRGALELLREHPWPGNVRELRNAIETAVALTRENVLDETNFAPLLRREETFEERNLPVAVGRTPEEVDRELIYRALFELKKDIMEIKDILNEREYAREPAVVEDPFTQGYSMQEAERRAIEAALKKTGGNKRRAALLLNISERTLYRKMKEYDL
jgi:transcriptional regulator with GAF, ATPase, and Fis domain